MPKPWAANRQVVVWGIRDGRFPALNAGVVSTVFTLPSIALLLGFVVVQWSDPEKQMLVPLLLVVPIVVGLLWTTLSRFNLGFQVLHVRASHAGVEVQYSFAPRLLALEKTANMPNAVSLLRAARPSPSAGQAPKPTPRYWSF